ncbi:hypothetical protein DPMN_041171 [Dreissena polymorpha]|uniref:Uncharacterized protein n=1 Tax=Dreissena polymorpha TaxID=45954 RepID=A0A9D4HXM3_DREPO|nr:hypothetical protein DPMN_041171 [Dreissena polymorpha]
MSSSKQEWIIMPLNLHCNWFFKFAFLLDSEHQIASIYILHDKIQAVLKKPTLQSKAKSGASWKCVVINSQAS